MFENIIGHTVIIEQIKKEIGNSIFPSSSIISGPLYSGKQTIALEAARALSCEKQRLWNCTCESCRLHRVLANPSAVLLGSDYFMSEISAARNMLERKNEAFSRYFFIRSVRKLTRRFDSDFYDENDSRIKKISSHISRIEELINDFDPDIKQENSMPDLNKADLIIDICRKISSEINPGIIGVDQIRRINFWVRFSGYGSKKIIIIENAEKMNESSRNALLKIIEEPPENTFFIFLTAKPEEISPTVRSRLRRYELSPRTSAENRTVIEKIFREEPGTFTSIKEYINSSIPEFDFIKKTARQLIIDIFDDENRDFDESGLRNAIHKIEPGFYADFLEELLELLRQLLTSNDFTDSSLSNYIKIDRLSKIINDCYINNEIYNIHHELLTESMYYRMKKY